MDLLVKVMAWGPVAFGALIFAPMWAAALDALSVELPGQVPNLAATLLVGLVWGAVAKFRGRWL